MSVVSIDGIPHLEEAGVPVQRIVMALGTGSLTVEECAEECDVSMAAIREVISYTQDNPQAVYDAFARRAETDESGPTVHQQVALERVIDGRLYPPREEIMEEAIDDQFSCMTSRRNHRE